MKKLFLLFAACSLSLAATAQTMNVHLKDGSTVQYASSAVDYVDFTAASATPAEEVWSLVSDSVSVVEYYGSAPGFTCSLYKNADGTKFEFRNFATDVNLDFTLSADTISDYLGYYLYPTGGAYYGTYWYFSDSLWNESYPLAWKSWPAHYLDYPAICVNTTYTSINVNEGHGWICLYAYPVAGTTVGDPAWYYYYFSWDVPQAPALTLADLVGTYTEATTGYWNSDCDYTDEVTIEIADEATNTITLKGFSTSAEDLTGVVDLEAKTITFAANQPFYTWYTFSAESAIDTPVVATIADDGTITIKDWSAWYNYGGTDYAYAFGMVSTLTKK
jgi:hypothetical protein